MTKEIKSRYFWLSAFILLTGITTTQAGSEPSHKDPASLINMFSKGPEVERSNIYNLPILDHYSIVAELWLDEVCTPSLSTMEEKETTGTKQEFVELNCHLETRIDVPHWVYRMHGKQSSTSEIPVFHHIQASRGGMNIAFGHGPLMESQIRYRLDITTPYHNKTVHTKASNLPKWPAYLANSEHELDALVLATNPLMLEEFNTDSHFLSSWIDNAFGSAFENQPITMAEFDDNVMKLKVGDHYVMAIVFDSSTNEPEAILLDDMQGVFRRNLYFFTAPIASPLVYLSNIHELYHHSVKAWEYGVAATAYKTISSWAATLNALNSGRNVLELTDHAIHVAQTTAGTLSLYGNETCTEEDNDEANYGMIGLDTFNLLCTGGEFFYEYYFKSLTPWGIADNCAAFLTGAANLMASSNSKFLFEPHAERIDKMILDWRYTFRDSYRDHKQKGHL